MSRHAAGAYCSANGSPEDTWFHDTKGESVLRELFDRNTRAAFAASVLETRQREAQYLLSSTPYVKLSQGEAQQFVSRGLPVSGQADFFLLRALSYDWQGDFLVNEYRQEVSVTFAFLGIPPGNAKRTAIVALLSEPPKVVYVTCSGAM
jgi:hypothetical protein